MNFDMRHEYFESEQEHFEVTGNVSSLPPILYPQSRDWTCALACLRSITSGLCELKHDDDLIAEYHLEPGPIYSKDIKRLGILEGLDLSVIYGCDLKDTCLSDLWDMMRRGYHVMTEWMFSYDHWTVALAYLATESNMDYHTIVSYDPYCGEVINVRAGHFQAMWQSAHSETNGVVRDFVAVCKNT